MSSGDNFLLDFVSKLMKIMIIVRNIPKQSGRIFYLGKHKKWINYFVRIQYRQKNNIQVLIFSKEQI